MILYHFTAIELLGPILREGLTKGEVPITRQHLENAVWFTTDPSPEGHGLTDGGYVSPAVLDYIERTNGQRYPDGIRMPDKRKVRIEVVIPSRDPRLKPWLPYARKRLTQEWMNTLTDQGGGKSKARTWFIYLGPVAPEMFCSVMRRDEGGSFQPMTLGEREAAAAQGAEL